jgi:hypothetical protein
VHVGICGENNHFQFRTSMYTFSIR